MPDIDWIAIGISWTFSTLTTFLILFIGLCLQRRSANRKFEKPEIAKTSVVDDKNTTYIPNPFSKAAYLEWASTKPLETSSPKLQKKDKRLVPLLSNVEEKVQKNDYYIAQRQPQRVENRVVNSNDRNASRTERKGQEKTNDRVSKSENKIDRNPVRSEKMDGSAGRLRRTEMIVDLKKSPAEKRRESRQKTKSKRFNRSDSQEGSPVNLTKETNLSNSQKNSERQLFFVKCDGNNSSRSSFPQQPSKSERAQKLETKDPRKHETRDTRITQLPPRPSRQRNSLVFLKESPRTKGSLERCHSSSPSGTPSPSRKPPSSEKLHTLHLKVDELCYTSLPSFNSPINT